MFSWEMSTIFETKKDVFIQLGFLYHLGHQYSISRWQREEEPWCKNILHGPGLEVVHITLPRTAVCSDLPVKEAVKYSSAVCVRGWGNCFDESRLVSAKFTNEKKVCCYIHCPFYLFHALVETQFRLLLSIFVPYQSFKWSLGEVKTWVNLNMCQWSTYSMLTNSHSYSVSKLAK